MGLVYDHTSPGDAAQLRTVGQDHLKGGDHGVEAIRSLDDFTLRGKKTEGQLKNLRMGNSSRSCYCELLNELWPIQARLYLMS